MCWVRISMKWSFWIASSGCSFSWHSLGRLWIQVDKKKLNLRFVKAGLMWYYDSQGAAVAALLAALVSTIMRVIFLIYTKTKIRCSWNVHTHIPRSASMGNLRIRHCKWSPRLIIFLLTQAIHNRKFCVSISGFRIRGSLGDAVFSPSYSTPTLHVIGKTDVIVIEERSRTLLEVSDAARSEFHEGGLRWWISLSLSLLTRLIGHFVPSKTSWRCDTCVNKQRRTNGLFSRTFFRDYLKDQNPNIPSPTFTYWLFPYPLDI